FRSRFEEAVEDVRERLGRYALAVVAHLDLQTVDRAARGEDHRRPAVLERVADQVGHDDVEPARVEGERQILGHAYLHAVGPAAYFQAVAHRLGDVDVLQIQPGG